MNTKFYQQDIERVMKENNCYYDWFIHNDGTIEINVEWGDWKHGHRFLVYIMRKANYRHISEIVTEEDGSDTFSATHKFRYGA